MADSKGDFISQTWTARTELRLVNGVWRALPTGTPSSSSAATGKPRKPTSLRERQELEAAEKAAEEAAKAEAEGDGEAADDADTSGDEAA